MPRKLVVYQRERSGVWQCRYKVDGKWQRASTGQTELKDAITRANELLIEAEIRKRSNLPVITRRFRDVAKLAVQRMEDELKNNAGKVTYKAYIAYINSFLTPVLGKRNIERIDAAALDEVELYRIKQTQKPIAQSTKLTQNAALNRVFDEAELRGFLSPINRPKLDAKGIKSQRRPAFGLDEVRALRANFDDWIESSREGRSSRELRTLLRDYCEVLLDTGARPGVELMNLQWKQVKYSHDPKVVELIDGEDGETEERFDLREAVEMSVSGKTGRRTIIGTRNSVKALVAIAKRNYPDFDFPVINKLKNVIKLQGDDFVFRLKNKVEPSSFTKMFYSYLKQHNLLIDPLTGQERVFYSLRHTYATLALTYDKIPIHTLAKQMGTSVLMIEKHYSHLQVVQAIEQLRREETRQLIDAGPVDEVSFKSNLKKSKS